MTSPASSPASASSLVLRCQGVLFDMDGILISSLGSVERSWTRWAEMRGVDPVYACSIAHGCRSIETVARLRPDLDPEIENGIVEQFEIDDKEDVHVLPGVLKLLGVLPRDRWTVVTSATEPLARVRLAVGGIPVPERIITADNVSRGKPDPAPYLAGAALLGLAPEDCIVFEDAESGTISGHAAGCTVVATTFSHSVESLKAANYLIDDLTGVEVVEARADGSFGLRFTPLERG
jgi:mannitol-1-/sugar-/sorbitol-6-phosphatase